MQRLYHLLGDNRTHVTVGLAVVLSLALMALGPSRKVAVARSVVTGLLGLGHRVFAWPMDIAGLRYENQVLREQNLRLSLEVLELREAGLENERLRGLLRFRREAGNAVAYLAARVVARDPDYVPNAVLIDVGRSDGVRERMPVVTADGLVGRVLETHSGSAVVQLLLDRNCRVSAIVQRRDRVRGIALCEDGTFYLEHVPLRAEITVGDVVVSSGLGGVFPKGLLVGYVERVGEEEQGLFREVILTTGVNFSNLEEVFVLKQDPGQRQRVD